MADAKEVPPLPWPDELMGHVEIAAFLKINKLIVKVLCALHRIPCRRKCNAKMLDRTGQAAFRAAYLRYRGRKAALHAAREVVPEPRQGWVSTGDFARLLRKAGHKVDVNLVEILCTEGEILRYQVIATKYLDLTAQARFREQHAAYVRAVKAADAAGSKNKPRATAAGAANS